MLLRFFVIAALFIGMYAGSGSSAMLADSECEPLGPDEIDVCNEFLEFWDANDGAETLGDPLTDQFNETAAETGQHLAVQYFEHARLEHHPDMEGTPYEVQLGRLGSELLAAGGIYWHEYPEADPDDPYFASQTGQAIDHAFQEFWLENGLDLSDGDGSFRESLARFGYPLTPAEEVDGEDTVLIQWFERTRLELNASGDVSAVAVGSLVDDDADGLSIRVQRELEALIDTIYEAHDAPGLGVWLESSELGDWEWSFGHADFEDEVPYGPNTHHRIGSVNKPIVASVVLQLVEEGLLELDDTVDQWFPELNGADQVTVRMLGNMTSGIFNYSEALPWYSAFEEDRHRVWEPEELLNYAFTLTGTAEPDGTWEYSNTNYVMLGLIIEELTGNDLADEFEARVFDPLGMENTSFPAADDPTLPEPFARGLSAMGLGATPEESTEWSTSWAHAAGQIISTPSDLLAWLPELYHGSLLSEEMRQEFHRFVDVQAEEMLDDEPDELIEIAESGYGFGVIYGDGWYTHDGLVFGYATMTAYRPDIDTALVLLSNADIFSSDMTIAPGMGYYMIQQVLEREYPFSAVDQ